MNTTRPQPRRLGQIAPLMLGGVAAVGLGLAVILGVSLGGGDVAKTSTAELFTVDRGGFEITVPCSGELAAMRQIEIYNTLEGRAVISEIVDEGTIIEEGQVLLRFDDGTVKDNIKKLEEEVSRAKNSLDAAKAAWEIQKQTQASEIAERQVTIDLAEIALEAWIEGHDISKKQELEMGIQTAEKDHDRLAQRFEHSQTLKQKDFINNEELLKDEIAYLNAQVALKTARLNRTIYLEYTREQELKKLSSDVTQATAESGRARMRLDASVRAKLSDVELATQQVSSTNERLEKLQDQLSRCTVTAPASGLVVYASSLESMGWRDRDNPPSVGTELNRNQPVIVLPDTSQMIAEVKVNEALSGMIKSGQSVLVSSDALPDQVVNGEVLQVGVLAEGGGWRDPNRRDYTVKVKLHDAEGLGLKPSMRCKAEIVVAEVDDVLYIPIPAIHRSGAVIYTYVLEPDGFHQRAIKLGQVSDLYAEILDGLEPGGVVLLRKPAPSEIAVRIEDPS